MNSYLKNIMRLALFQSFLQLITVSVAFSAITFSGGKWETTFNCIEWLQGDNLSCDQLGPGGAWTSNGQGDQITTGANNPLGAGGRGFRHWVGDGININGGGLNVNFPSPQTELWIRYYHRYEAGFKWLGLNYNKILYINTGVSGIDVIPEYYSDDFVLISQGTPDYYQVRTTYGWSEVMGASISDGLFHCFDIHIKMDTNGSDGVGQLWIDGDLKASNTTVNWSNGNSTARLGWTRFGVGSNQRTPDNGRNSYNDFDDIVVYNTPPPNKDSQGNSFIGPIVPLGGVSVGSPIIINGACGSANGQSFTSLASTSPNLCLAGTVAAFAGSGPWAWGCSGSGGGTSTSSTACSASLATTTSTITPSTVLFSESFEDSSYASRGWYDNTNHGTIASGGQTGNCLQWAWAGGSTTPTNGGSMRMKFTPSDSLYVSYYVKFQTGWRGSEVTYHPHMIYILSDLDSTASAYSPLANNYLDTYLEFISDTTSPYAIRPVISIQDEKRVNTSYGTPPNNLTATTENRSVAYCNTPVSTGAAGTCYADAPYYSANTWKASTAALPTNAWHKVEVYLKMNSISGGKGISDGIMQEWIDGTLVINQNDVLYRTNQDATKKWAQFVFAPYMAPTSGGGSPISQTMWIDELKVMTAPPISSSITPPAGLTIKSITP